MNRDYIRSRLELLKSGETFRYVRDHHPASAEHIHTQVLVQEVKDGVVYGACTTLDHDGKARHHFSSVSIDELLNRQVEFPIGWTSEKGENCVGS